MPQNPHYQRPKLAFNNEKKLNYISLFEEKTDPSLNMIKIHVKKKHEVPGPQAYNRQPKWTYCGSGDDPKKGKWRPGDRLSHTAEIMRDAKRAKTPGPGAYKPTRAQEKISGFSKTNEPMGLMILEAKYRGK